MDNYSDIFNMAKDPAAGSFNAETISENDLFKAAGHTEIPKVESNPFQPQETPQPQLMPTQESGFNIGAMIDAEMAVELADIGMTAVTTIALKTAFNIKAKKTDIAADAKQKELLVKPMKAALEQSNIHITNPFEALFYSMLVIYGSKAAALVLTRETPPDSSDLNTFVNRPTTGKRGRPRKS